MRYDCGGKGIGGYKKMMEGGGDNGHHKSEAPIALDGDEPIL